MIHWRTFFGMAAALGAFDALLFALVRFTAWDSAFVVLWVFNWPGALLALGLDRLIDAQELTGAALVSVNFALAALSVASWSLLAGWWAARRRKRRNAGLCEKCGYDLRATPDRCPECGSPNPGVPSSTLSSAAR